MVYGLLRGGKLLNTEMKWLFAPIGVVLCSRE
jgi:hypothetical protein